METLLDEFLEYLRYEKCRPELTVENYGADIRAFIKFVGELDESLAWETVDIDVVRSWMESMMDKGNTTRSVNRRLSGLRTFFKFAVARGKLRYDPAYQVKGPKKTKPLPQYLREAEMNQLLDDTCWGDDFLDVRDRTIILVFYTTGMRLSELIGLRDDSFDYSQKCVKVLGKRNKERLIPFGPELGASVEKYVALRDASLEKVDESLFVTKEGRRMTAAQVRGVVKKNLSKVSTLKKRTPHVLRHTFATAMLNNKSGLESVQKLLGHESVATTEIYTHTTFEQLRNAYTLAHPRGEGENDQSEEK